MYRYEEDKAEDIFTNEQWARIWEQSASHSIEHIQAQETGSRFVHFLGNLMLLPPGLNSKLSTAKPKDKVAEYRATGLRAAADVADVIESRGWGSSQVQETQESSSGLGEADVGVSVTGTYPIHAKPLLPFLVANR